MKKYILLFVPCLLLVACSREQLQVSEGIPSEKEYVLDVSIANHETKSGVSEFGSFYWTSDDQLAIYTTENHFRTFSLKDGAGLSTATFSGVLSESEFPAEIAVSPAWISSSYTNGKLEVVLPERYEYKEDSSIGNPPMLALLNEDGGILFNHLCAMLRFTLDQVPAGANSVRITSEGSRLVGAFTVSLAEEISIPKEESSSGNSIMIEFQSLDYPKTMTFNFPIPVGTYENLTLEILGGEKNVMWSKKMNGSRTFATGQLMVFDTISTFPKVIDLGLPSGTLWADRNIGAKDSTDDGALYAWGEIETKEDFTLANYKYADAEGMMIKYNDSDSLIELDASDDVATITLGPNWRIPTKEEMEELLDNCKESKQKDYCLYTGPNGNSVVFAYGGIKYDGKLYRGQGHYWARTIDNPKYTSHANCMHLYYNEFVTCIDRSPRYQGLLIRPVFVQNEYFDITSTSVSIFVDENFDLDVTGTKVDDVIWRSENEAIAKVDQSGLVIGISEGQTTIVVSSRDGSKKQSCVVRVVPDVASHVSASFAGGAMMIINGIIQSGSSLNFSLNNSSNRAIRIENLVLIDGISGKKTTYIVSANLSASSSATYNVVVGSGGIQKPTGRFTYLYEGKSYTTECIVPMN